MEETNVTSMTPSKINISTLTGNKTPDAPKSLYKNNSLTNSHYVLKLAKENR